MEHTLLITIDGNVNEAFSILTNDFELNAEELGEIYRFRWQIEFFFKWLKQHAQIKHFYGTSETAVINQLLLVLMTYCILILLQLEIEYTRDLLTLQRMLIVRKLRFVFRKSPDDEKKSLGGSSMSRSTK